MSYIGTNDFYKAVANGEVPGWSVVHKFGARAVTDSFTPVAEGGFYRTPQVAGATQLRVKAGNAADSSSNAGAREVTLVGLDTSGNEITETVATAGGSASANTSNTFLRLHRLWVSKSGTYATQSAGSHVANIVIENSAGTEDWATITATDFPWGQSQIGVYSIPTGKTGFIKEVYFSVDSQKSVDIAFFQRTLILETAAPYSGVMRLITEQKGVKGVGSFAITTPINGFTGPCDIGFMAKTATTADVTVDFEILLKNT